MKENCERFVTQCKGSSNHSEPQISATQSWSPRRRNQPEALRPKGSDKKECREELLPPQGATVDAATE
jgi:hypothetical protein